MKKKKPPVLLVSLLVVLATGGVIFSLSDRAKTDEHDNAPLADAAQEAPSADELASRMKSAAPASKSLAPGDQKGSSVSLTLPKEQPALPKPKYNPDSMRGQWYTEESAKSTK